MQAQKVTEATLASRRSERDRRAEDDVLSPKGKERRHSAERRLPIVDESTVSFSEWVRSMVVFLATIRKRSKVKLVAKHHKPKKW
jgi:hypothetical protein